ncbi:MAG: AbiV family abortive infection protein [Planctomycetes bacterium]|nr:AbiV family abortive infection protein [Planctomycetota bacterium]
MNVHEFIQKQRKGTLSVDEIGSGMHMSFVNAVALIEDAEILLKRRPGRSISLAVLAIEEIAKVVMLADAALRAAISPVDWTVIQKDLGLRSHQNKQFVFAAYGRSILKKIASNAGKSNYYENPVPEGIVPLLDYFKQLGFYVDLVNGRFTSPQEFGMDNRKWAKWLIKVAKERLASIEHLHCTKAKSIKLAREAAELARIAAGSSGNADLIKKIKLFLQRKRTAKRSRVESRT